MPSRILVTGAGGFVGRHLAAALHGAGHHVLAAGFDLTDPAAVRAGVAAARPDACVHLAAVSAVQDARRDPARAWRVNLDGTLNLADALLAEAPDALLLFASSADAYGASFGAGQALDEAAVLAPMNTYAATKAAADLALGALAAARGLRVLRVRPFNHIGPGQSAEFAVPAFARQIARIEAGLQPPVIQVGDLSPQRDFLDVRDVCRAYVACLARPGLFVPPGLLNVASGVPRRVGDVLDALRAMSAVAAEVAVDPARRRPSEIASASGDARRAARLLDWSPAIPWETTLADVLADWRARVSTDADPAPPAAR